MRPLICVFLALSTAASVAAQGVTVRGVVYDSLHSHPLAGAFVAIGTKTAMSDSTGRFMITDIAPGTYRVTAQHDDIDKLGMSAIGAQAKVTDGRELVTIAVPSFSAMWRLVCGPTAPAADTGFVFGTIRSARANRTAEVSASWIDVVAAGTKISQKLRTLETTADSSGNFTLCGVPTTTGFTVRALADSLDSGAFDVDPMDRERILRRDLTMFNPMSAPNASFTGRVVSDSGGLPMAKAEVEITDLGLKATADDQGAFSFSAVPPGSHRVSARRIGYGEVEVSLDFQPGERVSRNIAMGRVTVLDSMSIKAKSLPRDEGLRAFEEHRKLGLGKFITAEELEKSRNMKITSLMRSYPGLQITKDGTLVSKRGIKSIMGGSGCAVRIYLDGAPLLATDKIDDIPPETLAGLEYYPGGASVPIEYARLNHQCGVVLLHSRYKTGK